MSVDMSVPAIEFAKAILERNGYTVTPPKPPEVKYRPAEWPRDWGRTDVEFRDDGGKWIPFGPLAGMVPDQFAEEFCAWLSWGREDEEEECEWFEECRVPILPGDEYREPVLPADRLVACEFSVDGVVWAKGTLYSYACVGDHDDSPWCDGKRYFKHARIRRKSGYEWEGK